ncbi:Arm DNA-binding domain-containing protein [Pseudarcicella hirudinis]|uniref:Arm DNA-binding domain-containing protein n=1 Tax=Pseudarcicella hirudinis TaxID=1079859 RepID=UPI0035E7C144
MNHHIYFRTRSQGISEKSQKVPIYARIFYNDEWSTDFSTGIRTNKNKWNPQDQVIESDLSGQNQENIKLDLIRNDITRIINTWIMKGKEFVANDVRRAYIMKEVPKPTIWKPIVNFSLK